MISKTIKLALLVHNLMICASAPTQANGIPSLKHTFIVMLKKSEDIISAKGNIVSTQILEHPQAEIYCPGDSSVLNLICRERGKCCKVPLEKQIELKTVINPVLPLITQLLKDKVSNKPHLGFIVGPDQCAVAALFGLSALGNRVIFQLENNQIDPKWFI